MLRVLYIVGVLVCVWCSGQAQQTFERSVATSIPTLEQLLKTEEVAIDTMEKIVVAMKKKMDLLNYAVRMMRMENNKAKEDPEKYLSNPINAYSLVRRTHEDWLNWLLYLEEPADKDELENLKKLRSDMPTKKEMDEASEAIQRLEEFYLLKPADVVKGKLNGVQYKTFMHGFDAYAIGYSYFVKDSVAKAVDWLTAAAEHFKPFAFDEILKFSASKIHTLLAEAYIKNGQLKKALDALENILETNPHDMEVLVKRNHVEYQLKTLGDKVPAVPTPPNIKTEHVGCRGDYPPDKANLFCTYISNTTSFVKLAPIKAEVLSLNPYMLLYHDVIFDSEIGKLKEMSRSVLRRATVFNATKGKGQVVNTRTSQFAWFNDNTNNETLRLSQRITDMTGFTMRNTEQLQGMNYGMGGHYSTHYDYFENNPTLKDRGGNRKATVLFYMSDVEQGGGTVFPVLQKTVFPKKGTAVMWYNMDNRGEVDKKTLHTACPVLVGSKWVTNKWIRENDQMFLHPCRA